MRRQLGSGCLGTVSGIVPGVLTKRNTRLIIVDCYWVVNFVCTAFAHGSVSLVLVADSGERAVPRDSHAHQVHACDALDNSLRYLLGRPEAQRRAAEGYGVKEFWAKLVPDPRQNDR